MRPPERDEALATPGCCRSAPDPRIARHFDQKSRSVALEDVPPLINVSSTLLRLLRDAPTMPASVLELGCGTGALTLALLRMGVNRALGIDLSPGSIDVARRRAVQAAFADRATFEVGDAAEAALQPHDWVVLDRVLCCFRDADRLLANAIRAGASRIAISVPESRGFRGLVNRPLWAIERVWDLLRGGCPGYVHDLRRIERQLGDAGFVLARRAGTRGGLWYVGVYDRVRASDLSVSGRAERAAD